jgi:molybdopterin molybdotransferase
LTGDMAQLSNDCFDFGGPLLPLHEARALIGARLAPVTAKRSSPLSEADGCILAQDVVAPIDLPPFDNSAVDGFAVRFGDLAAGATLFPVEGRAAAGADAARPAMHPHAVRIFTGAPMPEGFDTVFMQEDVRPKGERVLLPAGLKQGANRRLAGEDLRRGDVALAAGTRLDPRAVALLASLGLAEVPVRTPLRVAVFSTGDEVVAPGAARPPAALFDANRFMLTAMLRRLGCAVTDGGILPDRREAVAAALAEAAQTHDLLVTTGGVSTGEEDHVKAAVEAEGALTFWRLAVKPGRPVAMGIVRGVPFIGLPGNPVAVFVTFVTVARSLVARLAGESFTPPPSIPVRAGFSYRKKEGRREFVRVRLMAQTDGALCAVKHPKEGTGIITSLTRTDGLAELPESATDVAPGDIVAFIPYAALV